MDQATNRPSSPVHSRPGRIRHHSPLWTTLLGTAALLLGSACSGSGGGSTADQSQGPSTLSLAFTSEGNSPARAVVTGVMFESTDGTVGPNLLAAPQQVQIADAAGQPGILDLGSVPPMEVRAVLIGFGTTAPATLAAGTDQTVQIPLGLRAPAAGTVRFDDSGGRQLAEVSLPDVATSDWWTRCSLRDDRGIDLPGAECEVLQLDSANDRCTVLWRRGEDSYPIDLAWDGQTLFSDDSGPRGDDSLMRQLSQGDRIDLACTVQPRGTGSIHRCHRPSVGFGDEGKLLATLQSVNGSRITVDLVAIRRLPVPAFGPVGTQPVFETAGAPITSDYAPWVQLTTSQLQPGDLLEIEIRRQTVIAPGVWQAHEVEVEDHPGQPGAGQEIEGAVGSIDTVSGTITMVPRGDDPLVVGGTIRPQVIVELTATTWLYLDDPSTPIALNQINPGQRIWVKGPAVVGNGPPVRITGREIRIRND